MYVMVETIHIDNIPSHINHFMKRRSARERKLKALIKSIVGLLFVSVLTIPTQAQDVSKKGVLDRDLALMMTWFEGEFDNNEQVYFEGTLKVGDEEKHERIHSIFKRAELPEIGKNIFYVQQYSDGDPNKVYRQRLYKFTPNYERGVVALEILSYKDAASVRDAHLDMTKLNGLTVADLDTMPEGCTVFWERRANQFVGFMDDGACQIKSKRSGKMLTFDDDLLLTDDQIWIQDRAEDADGNYVYGNKASVAHKLLKQNTFTCWVYAVDEKAKDGGHFNAGVKISDQGGEHWIDLTGENGKNVGIKMRNVHWPYGRNRNSLVLYAYKDGGDSAVSYVWAEPEAKRIALNLRWMQASCTRN